MKHLNPRQGITTVRVIAGTRRALLPCETPKSPPGDYNHKVRAVRKLYTARTV